MSRLSLQKMLNLRPLITETLPYEVPLIFSNDLFFTALAQEHLDEEVGSILKKITSDIGKYTIPYNYSIRKSEYKDTILSVVHPLMQVEIAGFYKSYADTMLYHCSTSDFSLRRPTRVASIYSEKFDKEDDSELRSGVVEERSEIGLPDLSRLVSYFVYEKYNLFNKFIDSVEFIRHEKDFCMMRSIDISKCFYNIYTHSVTWAVKDKEFSKRNINYYSFESEIDRLMQLINYNETNGIVVGPEFSRIFAEIILQDVDRQVQVCLEEEDGFHLYAHYVVRRYIDDYFIFANDERVLEKVSRRIKETLERYKLYPNSSKQKTMSRPFLTQISAARIEIGDIMARLRSQLKEASNGPKNVNRALSKIRSSIVSNDIEISNISSLLLGSLHNMLKMLFDEKESYRPITFEKLCIAILGVIYYVCSLDLRVNITYKLSQIIGTIYKRRADIDEVTFEAVEHFIEEENVKLMKIGFAKAERAGLEDDYIELYNLLIASVHFHDDDFMENRDFRHILGSLCEAEKMTYFRFITLKFCFLVKKDEYQSELKGLNQWAEGKIADRGTLLANADQFLLFIDYISSPDVESSAKLALVSRIFGGNHSKRAIELLARDIGFSDWTGMRIHHLLRRKELRPVYE